MSIIWHNGTFTDDAPVLTVHDRMRLGECVFNTMLAVDGRIYHATRHIEKLLRNAAFLLGAWDGPGAQDLEDAATGILKKNGLVKGRHAVNIIITGGPGAGGIRPPDNRQPQVLIRALPTPDTWPPVHAAIIRGMRRNEGSPLSAIKGATYGENILALREAQKLGANEAIMLNNRGRVACASVSNIAAVIDGQLVTPPLSDGAQDGTTRALLIERHGAIEDHIAPEALKTAGGIYLLNSLRGAVPVATLDGKTLPPASIRIDKDFHLF